ncbi:MAG: methylenetetrahydrofolate--tRNA-(uracil(54)-C(5))-methyltransferase (FADH(2)-oxidizing) TrmFO [Clostridia bacterium]|nr:methylenetetrahydrofolate--tRNA-(uracil(54)-C(5))-methyltransferase (FADH(2)-oxidizing) TrmFO [Clostridia bacterium]
MERKKVKIIGGGFAGCEAAVQLSRRGIEVELYEMKPGVYSPAHSNENLCELVCSNSFKAMRLESAAGMMKAEMKMLGSLCVECAEKTAVPAGGALAVDRDAFSRLVTDRIESEELITVIREEVTGIPDGNVIIAAGPLASAPLSESIGKLCGGALSFFDAAAPIVTAESIDFDRAFMQSRYDRGEPDDYINCPLNKEEYEIFYDALINAQSAETHEFDKRKDVYEGCMPVEVMASRGHDTIRFGPMKPAGLVDPKTGHRPWANLQLRKENNEGTMYNLVGFQTNLKFSEQKRVFSLIPALANAEYVRYGVMHRNTFIDSPRLLTPCFSMRQRSNLFFAGQITGVEGYMESAASGILAGINMANLLEGRGEFIPPETTICGALARYVSDESIKNFQPMGAAFGLLPPLENRIRDKKERYSALAHRGLEDLEKMLNIQRTAN